MASNWAASTLSWWQDAGVDTIVGEAPRDWLNPATKAAAAPAAAPLPDTLEALLDWLATSDELPLAAPSAARAAPAGDSGSGLMILVDMPAADGGLLTGEAGLLFDRMLGAIGRTRETIYLAPLSPVRTPTGAIDEASAGRLAEIARRHIALARPKAVLLFGDICGKALVGAPVAGARGRWHEICGIKALVTIKPEKLLTQTALKALAWADLQMLMEALA